VVGDVGDHDTLGEEQSALRRSATRATGRALRLSDWRYRLAAHGPGIENRC
jgi:hypothetical protein